MGGTESIEQKEEEEDEEPVEEESGLNPEDVAATSGPGGERSLFALLWLGRARWGNFSLSEAKMTYSEFNAAVGSACQENAAQLKAWQQR